MSLRISGKNINIGEAFRDYASQRLEAAAAKYVEGAANGRISGHVTLEPEGSGYRADCALHLSHGITLQAEGRAQEVYASFDQAANRIETRLRRYKKKIKDRSAGHHHASDRVEPIAYKVLGALDEDVEAPLETDFSPVVVAESTAHLSSMSVSAAVLELDLTGAPVIVFRHASNGRVNVIYRRMDGNIGWIDTPDALQKQEAAQ